MENKREVCSPFIPRRNPLRKTSAEIVREARQSLRVQSTHRPFTPSDGQRHLFGRNSIRVERDNRPPSAFSLHSQNFDAPDSRPGSGIRLSPLGHKPKFPVLCNAEDPLKAFPKPPSAPAEGRKGQTRARARLLKAASVSTLSPVEGHKEVRERLNSAAGQKPVSAKQLSSEAHATVHHGPLKPDPRRAASESTIAQSSVDSEGRPTDCRVEQETGRGYGEKATSTDKDPDSLVWNDSIVPLLQQLESEAAGVSEGSVDRLCDLCDRLHGALAEADMLGRRCKRRSGILRALFRLIDLNSVQLNLHVAKLCLALCVSENNLLNICKLVFQISRSENNDIFFQRNSIIDLLLDVLSREEVSSSGEALLYCVGTLKFLSGNSVLLRLLLEKNCIGVTQKLLQKLCAVEDTLLTISGHILVQLTATLRNLADHPDSRPLFVSFSILSLLCTVLRQHCEDQDICTNISRIFSKLSSYSECRLALAQTPDCYQLFLELLSKHHQKQDLVVRLLFTLGNLAAKSDEPRQQLFQCDGCVDTLIQLYRHYQQREAPVQKDGLSRRGAPARAASAQEAEDVLVKLVRLLANMCIHPTVGPSLAADAACVQLLMETLELRSAQESEELLVNVAATINNLSFYKEERSLISRDGVPIAKLMLKLMLSSSPEAMLEATRVYGNLSQAKNVRDFMMQNKVHLFMVALLDSKSTDVCFSACGVLINLAVDPPSRACLSQEGAAAKLVDCLRDLGPGDWQLAGRVCQALWNLTGSGSGDVLDPRDRDSLLDVLVVYADEEEAVKWIESEDARGQHKACWETHFLPVAQKLMKLLQTADSIP
ncbi:armadillo repeat-containing protein 2 [Salarias fasciatus]|uniref:armadillo repeat-containing protein 2 n=1 Tax=Salarias fasciatus TaxID=181472 RepID=UPI001176BF1E|nr:armadillo repeat-containing protein 2 [Salarias fasciatus]